MKKSRAVSPSVYTRQYYLHDCLGADEFKNYHGQKIHPRVKEMISGLVLKKGMKVLDIGCGRGDLIAYCARHGVSGIGIDYSKDGIKLAKELTAKQSKSVQSRMEFQCLDAKKMAWKTETFDVIFSFDVFEHLYPEELEIVLTHMQRMLKPDGVLLIHTEPNRIYLDFTHPFFIYPMSSLLIWINKFFTGSSYPGIPRDPRSDHHKKQHVNEPTYFYLSDLFKRHGFSGQITQLVSQLKPRLSWKDRLYNYLVLLYPLCLYPPFIYFFGYDYLCLMRKNHENKT